jgi:hypothetical protein
MLPYIYIFILGNACFQNAPHFSVFFSLQIRACLCIRMKLTLHKKGEFCCPVRSFDFRWVFPFLFVLMHSNCKFAEISPFVKKKISACVFTCGDAFGWGHYALHRASSGNGLSRGVTSLHLIFRLQERGSKRTIIWKP